MTPPELDRKSPAPLAPHQIGGALAIVTGRPIPLEAAAGHRPGLLIEPNSHGLAVRSRLAPQYGNEVWRPVRERVLTEHPWFHLVPARKAVEIVGDDFTDEAGMSDARELDGFGLLVVEAFRGNRAAAFAWLTQDARRPDGLSASVIVGAAL